MKPNLKKIIRRNLLNIPGWSSNRKIVVIESDDWGSIRTSSSDAYHHFLKNGYPVDECPYNSYDSLESNDDMELLFEVLSSVKDKNGNPAVITANNIVANPDFEKIEAVNYQQYFFERFTATLQRYPRHDRVEELYREGIEKQMFIPQFHGREHVNTNRWLHALQNGDKAINLAFKQSMFSVHYERNPLIENTWMEALDGDTAIELSAKAAIIQEGLQLFQSIWGFQSKSFIAPSYIWESSLEAVLAANAVEYIQGMVNQMEPIAKPGYTYKKTYHYQGQRNKHGQRYLIRNAFFEPSGSRGYNWVDDCLHRIETAFRWDKPAIISSHRVNFIGFINPKNREANLPLLLQLLKKIVRRWPDVEFMSSDQLGDLMKYGEGMTRQTFNNHVIINSKTMRQVIQDKHFVKTS